MNIFGFLCYENSRYSDFTSFIVLSHLLTVCSPFTFTRWHILLGPPTSERAAAVSTTVRQKAPQEHTR